MYATENREKFPFYDDQCRNFIFEGDLLYPEYLSDAAIMACPSDPQYDPNTNFRLTSNHPDDYTRIGQVHPDCIYPISYVYAGYIQLNDINMISGLAIYTWVDSVYPISDPNVNSWRDVNGNMASFGFTGWGVGGGSTTYRLTQGVDRFLIKDINSVFTGKETGASIVPVMWDQISTDITQFSHVPAGQNCLYLDGHVEFHRYDLNTTKYPFSPLYAAVNGATSPGVLPYCE
jgi:prepilin-type processing-associated H-X9-DG protein